jgi:hypothetical protein
MTTPTVFYRSLFFGVIAAMTVSSDCFAQFETLSQSYNLLSTIAGKGGSGDGDVNEWDSTAEGKPAVEAVLSGPHFAMADSAGNVYIADKNAHAIRKVDVHGIITTVAGTNRSGDGADGRAVEQALNFPNGLWVNKKGEYYILDLGNNKVRKVDMAGNMTTLFRDSAGISIGRGLWVNSTEDTVWYVGGTAVKMWTAAGGIVTWADGFMSPGNIVQDRNGFVVVTDRSGHRVYRIDSQGTKTVIAGNGTTGGGGDGSPALETGFDEVRGVWFLDDNSYFLATHEGSQVWHIDNQGIAHLFLNGKNGDDNHSGDGENYRTQGFKVSEVRSVTVDYRGNVLIVENDRGFVRKIAKADVGIVSGRHFHSGSQPQLRVNRRTGSALLTYRHRGAATTGIAIVNQQGQAVDVPMAYTVHRGVHEVRWENGTLPGGLYFVVVRSDAASFTVKMPHVR